MTCLKLCTFSIADAAKHNAQYIFYFITCMIDSRLMLFFSKRLGSIVADFDLIYDSSIVNFEETIIQASVELASGSNLSYDGISVAAKTGIYF